MHILLSHCCNNGNRGRRYNTVAQMGTVAIVETYRYNMGDHYWLTFSSDHSTPVTLNTIVAFVIHFE
jgi:hypothetical protein